MKLLNAVYHIKDIILPLSLMADANLSRSKELDLCRLQESEQQLIEMKIGRSCSKLDVLIVVAYLINNMIKAAY